MQQNINPNLGGSSQKNKKQTKAIFGIGESQILSKLTYQNECYESTKNECYQQLEYEKQVKNGVTCLVSMFPS